MVIDSSNPVGLVVERRDRWPSTSPPGSSAFALLPLHVEYQVDI
jgi:hypothetical protein